MSQSTDLLKQADEIFRQRQYAEATEIFQQAVTAAEQEDDRQSLTEALSMVARGFLIRDMKVEGRPWIERASEQADRSEPRGWSRYLGVHGRFQWQDDDKSAATTTFREMYDYCLEHQLHDRAVDAAHMVAITGTPEQQIEWAAKGIAAAEQGNLDGWLGPLWNNLGATHEDAEQFDKALEAYLKAREYHWKVGDEQAKLIADYAVGRTYRRLDQHDKALAWLRPVLAWSERRYAEQSTPDRGEWVGLTCWELGEIAAAQSNPKEARELLTRARDLLQAAKMPEWDATGWQELNRRIESI